MSSKVKSLLSNPKTLELRSNVSRGILGILPVTLVLIGVFIALYFINQSLNTSRANNVYVRYIACALSVDPMKRTDKIIDQCWTHVIHETGVDVHRYDKDEDMHPWLKDAKFDK